MPSTSRSTTAWAARSLLLAMSFLGVDGALTQKGCFSSSQPLTNQGTDTYQSSGNCQQTCVDMNKPVLALSDSNVCWCGDQLPAKGDKVSDSKCDTPCDGWPDESCGGGTNFFTVWLTGVDDSVGNYNGGSSNGGSSNGGSSNGGSSNGGSSNGGSSNSDNDDNDDSDDSTSSSAAASSSAPPTTTGQTTRRPSKPTVITSKAPGTTVIITKAPDSTESPTPTAVANNDDGDSTNVAGIAAGVVVGVLAAIAIAAGIFFFLRHKRKNEAEEEYKKTQVSDFMRGGDKRPPATGYSNMSDSRLDPEAGARRDSHGSIADDQDYSRRILRVANPDNS